MHILFNEQAAYERVIKRTKVFLILCEFNHVDFQWLETKSLFCSINRDYKANINRSKNVDDKEEKEFWDFYIVCGHAPLTQGDNYYLFFSYSYPHNIIFCQSFVQGKETNTVNFFNN